MADYRSNDPKDRRRTDGYGREYDAYRPARATETHGSRGVSEADYEGEGGGESEAYYESERTRTAAHSESEYGERTRTVSHAEGGRTHTQGTHSRAQHTSDRYGQGQGSGGHVSGAGRSAGTHKKRRKKKKHLRLRIQPRFYLMLGGVVLALALIVVLIDALAKAGKSPNQSANASLSAGETPSPTKKPGFLQELFKTPTPTPTPTPSPTPTPTPAPPYAIPHAVETSEPAKWELGTRVNFNGTDSADYERKEKIDFVYGTPYTAAEGVITFRGNNLRDGASYGTASVVEKKLTKGWTVDSSELTRSDIDGPNEATWTGSGWVGQPLIVRWPESTKRIMNMYDSAKQKEGLVEVIYATMDGNVYFLDLDTGEPTRDKLVIGMPFKGAGALDPRGYPLLYLGSGDMYAGDDQKARAMVYSLIDFTRLYEFGKQNDPFALRDWHAYDSSPLVDAATDTLIYPGENGILYTIKLNTVYNEAAGTISVDPTQIVKFRYAAKRSTFPKSTNTSDNKYWLGYETSIAILGEYGYLGTNDGFLQCINLNTLKLVWAQDTVDDTNGSPVIEVDEDAGEAYVYIGCSLHFTRDADSMGVVPFMKVNASTGEILWKHEETVSTKSGVSGGIQATALLGKGNISDLVIIPFARTPEQNSGVLLALDKADGSVRWTFPMTKYTWSSPVAVYDESGKAYIVVCEGSDTGGKVFLLDGKTGTVLNSFDAEKNIEASPAVYGNMIVIGTRGMKIWGIKIT